MVDAQQYIEQTYPPFIRKHIKWIDLTKRNLEGELDLREFESLETFWCSYNSITKIHSLEKTNLKSLRCCNNQITNLDFDLLLELEDLDCDIKLINLLWKKDFELSVKENPARHEIEIIVGDEKQVELEIEFGSLPEDISPITPTTIKRLEALEENYNRLSTHKLETKQQKRQFQILVPPKNK